MVNKTAKRYKDATSLKNAAGQSIVSVERTSTTAAPNSITQRTSAKGGIDRNFYGNDDVDSIEKVMGYPLFDGACLNDIAEELP